VSEKVAAIFWSDTHQNHKAGLCKPGFTPDGEETWQLNPAQRELWYAWESCWDWVDSIVPSGYKKVGFSVGDAVETDAKVRSPQELVSLSPKDAFTLAEETLEPIVSDLDYFFVIDGTSAHVGSGSWTEKALAKNLNAVPDESNNSTTWKNFIGELGGVKFDVAHHPAGNSNISRNYPAVASRLAYDIQAAYVMDREEKPPDLAIRGHLHRFADSGITNKTRGIILPCFQYKSVFISRIGKDHDMPDIGMVVVLCSDGEYELKIKRVRPREKRKTWRIEKKTTKIALPWTKS